MTREEILQLENTALRKIAQRFARIRTLDPKVEEAVP